MKKTTYLCYVMLSIQTLIATPRSVPQLNMSHIRSHEKAIRRTITRRSVVRNLFYSTTVFAVIGAALLSLRKKPRQTADLEAEKATVTDPEKESTAHLAKIREIQVAVNPLSLSPRYWFWNTEETREKFRGFLLSASIATIAARLGFFEFYQELLGKCSPYDAVLLFFEEKTRIEKLLSSLSYCTQCLNSGKHDTYTMDSLLITIANLNQQIEYLLGYMYYKSGDNLYKKNIVDHLVVFVSSFYTTLAAHLENPHENNSALEELADNFCRVFRNEIALFANTDALS